eukprot:scaffold965_cov120-Isochrysis_galbana.AAC.8
MCPLATLNHSSTNQCNCKCMCPAAGSPSLPDDTEEETSIPFSIDGNARMDSTMAAMIASIASAGRWRTAASARDCTRCRLPM